MNEKRTIPLKIFNASAGSGKTYHLVKEYIELLIGQGRSTDSFAHIIAMTFTNKAAIEMKERIISALDQISSPIIFDNKANELTKDLANDLGIEIEKVISRCKNVLKLILHRYEDFHVMTIDKFNLRLIKSFGRDLDLPADFEVVLDETVLIEQIVDDLFNQLGEEGNLNLNELIFRYAKSNLEDESSWDFRRELVDFGKILQSEKNSKLVARLLEMDFSTEQYGRLQYQRKTLNAEYQTKVHRLRELHHSGIYSSESIHGGSTTINGIAKIINVTNFPYGKDHLALIGKTVAKNMDKEDTSTKSFPPEVRTELIAINEYWESKLEDYVSLDLFLKNFFNMALLQYMAEALQRVEKEEQIIRISSFNTLISSLIQDEKAPFIYERLGTRFQHFLLDEFQDTSRLQWLNMVPLVHNSISEGHKNLIVGDPKQSIYRFKNGIAEQFVALPSLYNPEKDPKIASDSSYFESMGEVIELENNWRSSPSIVSFNNAFFEKLRVSLPESSAPFYSSVFQHPKSKVNGRIKIRSWEEKLTSEDLVPMIQESIEECLTQGFDPGDICILGSRNYQCNTWALQLTELGYKVVSSDSLLIHSNLRVKLAIAYLQLRLTPSGENEHKRFAELYCRTQEDSYNAYNQYILENKVKEGHRYRSFNRSQFLADHFGDYSDFFFKYESLYDLILSFYRMMKFNELSDPYLHHLADILFEFGQKRGPDLKQFLDDYFATKNKIAVQIPESKDAIKVMTIHKSKGLEFPVVILPSLDFKMEIKTTFLLESGDYLIYKKPTKNEVLTLLQETQRIEAEQILTDNVNLCYVGMTRPIERLYIFNAHEKANFGRLFHQTFEQIEGIQFDEGVLSYETQDGERSNNKKIVESEIMSPTQIQDNLWFPDISLQDRPELGANDYLSEEVQFGLQFHLLMSRIDDLDQIEKELTSTIDGGEVAKSNESRLRTKLNDLFKRDDYLNLFSGDHEILSEQAIILNSKEVIRPDKIIVKQNETILLDFKTGIPSAKDEKQINQYKSTLESMGYPNVSSYLFYTSIDELRLVG